MCLNIGIPKATASDDGGEFKGRFKEILNAEAVEHITMTTHLACLDCFIRTIKNMLFQRIQPTKTRLAFVALKCG